ncbi:hypothetical protein [Devosia sp. 1566]|uniref:hypothetical protein n=1 Tax=Devosia sp. 1566 TaxID=2499144 RepID=UPI0013E3264D|nr:hypothetical protein [Devosia sp. 1566]
MAWMLFCQARARVVHGAAPVRGSRRERDREAERDVLLLVSAVGLPFCSGLVVLATLLF